MLLSSSYPVGTSESACDVGLNHFPTAIETRHSVWTLSDLVSLLSTFNAELASILASAFEALVTQFPAFEAFDLDCSLSQAAYTPANFQLAWIEDTLFPRQRLSKRSLLCTLSSSFSDLDFLMINVNLQLLLEGFCDLLSNGDFIQMGDFDRHRGCKRSDVRLVLQGIFDACFYLHRFLASLQYLQHVTVLSSSCLGNLVADILEGIVVGKPF